MLVIAAYCKTSEIMDALIIISVFVPHAVILMQFCLKLALLAALPECYGGLNGRVIYIDTESKFSSRRYYVGPSHCCEDYLGKYWYIICLFCRMIEIGESSFPQIFRLQGLAQKVYSFLSFSIYCKQHITIMDGLYRYRWYMLVLNLAPFLFTTNMSTAPNLKGLNADQL